jgi:hypothetical protein
MTREIWHHENQISRQTRARQKNQFLTVFILGAVKFSDFGVQAFRLANLSIWTPNYYLKIRKPARVEYSIKSNILNDLLNWHDDKFKCSQADLFHD